VSPHARFSIKSLLSILVVESSNWDCNSFAPISILNLAVEVSDNFAHTYIGHVVVSNRQIFLWSEASYLHIVGRRSDGLRGLFTDFSCEKVRGSCCDCHLAEARLTGLCCLLARLRIIRQLGFCRRRHREASKRPDSMRERCFKLI